METIIRDSTFLPQAANQLIQFANGRKKFVFYGEIGAGKTTLIQSLCKQLGVKEAVTSPTFSLVNEYPYTTSSGGQGMIHHLDLYRLKDIDEALGIGIEDFLYDENYCFIEWPELIEPLLPEEVIKIYIQIIEDSSRKIIFLLDCQT